MLYDITPRLTERANRMKLDHFKVNIYPYLYQSEYEHLISLIHKRNEAAVEEYVCYLEKVAEFRQLKNKYMKAK